MMKYTGKYYRMLTFFMKKYLKEQYGKDITKKALQKAPAIYKDMLSKCDGSGYEARFYTCGICALMKEYGFYDLVPAMCHLDYTMSEMGGASDFVREYTLASGGPYCDCGYKKKGLV